jgi:hypothetical protein
MLDRLLAGAGAVTDAADRAVRAVLRGAGSSAADTRPGSLALAALLLLFSAGFALVALEADVGPLRTMRAGDVAADTALADRIHATVDGHLASTYVETFTDIDADGEQDEGEIGEAWAYWMVDPETRRGVTVLSMGAPWEVFVATYAGVLATDPEYVEGSVDLVAEELDWMGVTLDPDHIIIAAADGPAGLDHDLADPWPADGTTVTVAGPRSVSYVETCTADPDGDGRCDDDEVDAFDVVVIDMASRRGVLVVTEEDPELVPVSLTGMLRRDASAVVEAVNAPGFHLSDYDIEVSATHVLDVGVVPTDPAAPLALAVLGALLALIILIGYVAGYVGYRREAGRPAGASTMVLGDAVPVRLSGVVRSPQGLTHVRDVAAVVRRFETRPEARQPEPTLDAAATDAGVDAIATPPAAGIPLDSTLIVERLGRPEGVALGVGELTGLSVGTATTFGGHRPAIRATAGTGPLILSFADAAERDRVAAELIAEAGLDLAAATPSHQPDAPDPPDPPDPPRHPGNPDPPATSPADEET